MNPATVDAALVQAVAFTERLANTYETQVAAGEVGANGNSVASELPIVGNRPPTALLYGRIQSGKTAAMILTTALCLDNGFRIVVVLTADNVALVAQTANRFKALDGPRVFSSTKEDVYEWEGQEDEIAEDIATDGIVLVCAKDAFHLPHVIQFLQEIDASGYPALVFDDEADAATPDTTLAARSRGSANAPQYPSTIHRRVNENVRPGEEGASIREILPHSLYAQVTATPYILFLQRSTSLIRPNVTFLLEPGAGYCGGQRFFGLFNPDSNDTPSAPLVLVPNTDRVAINRRRAIPEGLSSSVNFFMISAGAAALMDAWPDEGFKHLSHTSHLIDQHSVVAGQIERHLREIRRQIRDDRASAVERFRPAYAELQTTVPNAPPLDQIVGSLLEAIRQAEFIRVNSDTNAPAYGPRLNFLVGGNILGRGLTIDDLLVTYYIREAQVSQMDTVWQHARMYGYRELLMPFTRVYLPRAVARRFKEIHETEDELRELLYRESQGENVPIRIARWTRATRPNALETSSLRVLRGDISQIYPRFLNEDVRTAAQIKQVLERFGVPLAGSDRDARTTPIDFEDAINIINSLPSREDDRGRWNSTTVIALVDSFSEQYQGRMPVYVRGLVELPPVDGWVRGRLSGTEIDLIRTASTGVPALALMYTGNAAAPRGWYPTLVLPPGSQTYIINPV